MLSIFLRQQPEAFWCTSETKFSSFSFSNLHIFVLQIIFAITPSGLLAVLIIAQVLMRLNMIQLFTFTSK